MWWIIGIAGVTLLAAALWGPIVSNVEQPKYQVVESSNNIEIRDYAPMIVAEAEVSGDRRDAIGKGFRTIADYIFGNNTTAQKVPMTAPVAQQGSEKIAMTAPVTAQQAEDEYVVSFTMPSDYSMDNLPRPNHAAVSIEPVDSHLAAVAKFGGYFSESKADRAESELQAWITQQGLTAVGEPIVAQYDPPWKPGFARRNEIMIVVE